MNQSHPIFKFYLRLATLCILTCLVSPFVAQAQAPIFKISNADSSIKFTVKASVALVGTFKMWDATLVFASTDPTSGVLTINIQADSVDTGSGMKDGKLKGKDFFDVKNDPTISFVSTKTVQTGPTTYDVNGNFTIHGVSNPEKLTLTVSGQGTGTGEITGKMVFDRKDYGIDGKIPFIKIADYVDVTFDLKGKRVSGPPLVFKQ